MRALLRIGLAAAALAPAIALAGAKITIVNGNAPGVGFNDPTPAAPVGGNAGTTLGQQRLVAFKHAADIWAAELDSSVEIPILAAFVPLACEASAAVLGSAGAVSISRNFPGAEWPDTWYPAALANKRARADLEPGIPDIVARFNSEIGKKGCLEGSAWYYGLDANEGPGQIDLPAVLLHEFAHGLGFQSFTSSLDGKMFRGHPDVYSKYYLDMTGPKMREQLTLPERQASATNARRVAWNGPLVTLAVPEVLARGTPVLQVTAPASVAGRYEVGAASFGPPLTADGVAGEVVIARDDGASTTDACTTVTNSAQVKGRIALVDRGTCTFVAKARNVQAAGAIAMLVADNQPGSPPAGLGGTGPDVNIPSVRITLADGLRLKAALPVFATLKGDPAQRAGASVGGLALLYTPDPVQPGSSISHWDTSAFPNQLMEPAINGDLTHGVKPPFDLTLPLLQDIGWFRDGDLDGVPDAGYDQCPGSITTGTVIIGGVDSGVANRMIEAGCTLADVMSRCSRGTPTGGELSSCVTDLASHLAKQGRLAAGEVGALESAAAKSH